MIGADGTMIRVGLVGFGMAGRVFHAPLISSVAGLELAAVLERNSDHAAERYPGITTYRSLDQLLADESLGLIVVATPSGTHFDVARRALDAGQNVVVDKPMAPRASEIKELIEVAEWQGAMLAPFHNRRWDGDFLTVKQLLRDGVVGRLVEFESRMDRWNPGATRKAWKNDPEQGGGVLLDLGTHLADQALALFGPPLALSAEVTRERDGEGADDAFTLRLRYEGFRVTLASNMLSSPPGARFVVRGTKENYRKTGVDPQEAALNRVSRIEDPSWGKEPESAWGELSAESEAGPAVRRVETLAGDYRKIYEGVRDTLTGKGHAPVSAEDAWRVAKVLEWARVSSETRREVECAWK
ncbi:MAG TPA: Gfo/Idh/MocA family oxidoreductase [Terracidiphilus sp.]|nr:Gfo/Idh/MocA family oxidoreductase [Terracidiphilus sp.]